ncbi:MAG: hypothetical protein ACREV7_19550 [Steroidobacteraceae bacterium]
MVFQRTKILILCKTYPSPSAKHVETSCVAGVTTEGQVLALEITPAREPEWTDEERQKLIQQQVQGDLFADPEAAALRTLRKIPFDFYYRFWAPTEPAGREHRLKIVDWEAGALYWNARRKHGNDWQRAFRDKFEKALPASDLKFLLGTIHRFPDQWLIVSVIYPPKQPQGSLDLA